MADARKLKKRLQKLLQLPDNQICSDCNDNRPRWASLVVPPPGAPSDCLPIGSFICIECSGAHRRLGVHITFVRSIDLDTWKEKEVLAMEQGGNAKVNALFEATLEDPDGSIKPNRHADNPTREAYIRKKYEERAYYDASVFETLSTEPPTPPPAPVQDFADFSLHSVGDDSSIRMEDDEEADDEEELGNSFGNDSNVDSFTNESNRSVLSSDVLDLVADIDTTDDDEPAAVAVARKQRRARRSYRTRPKRLERRHSTDGNQPDSDDEGPSRPSLRRASSTEEQPQRPTLRHSISMDNERPPRLRHSVSMEDFSESDLTKAFAPIPESPSVSVKASISSMPPRVKKDDPLRSQSNHERSTRRTSRTSLRRSTKVKASDLGLPDMKNATPEQIKEAVKQWKAEQRNSDDASVVSTRSTASRSRRARSKSRSRSRESDDSDTRSHDGDLRSRARSKSRPRSREARPRSRSRVRKDPDTRTRSRSSDDASRPDLSPTRPRGRSREDVAGGETKQRSRSKARPRSDSSDDDNKPVGSPEKRREKSPQNPDGAARRSPMRGRRERSPKSRARSRSRARSKDSNEENTAEVAVEAY